MRNGSSLRLQRPVGAAQPMPDNMQQGSTAQAHYCGCTSRLCRAAATLQRLFRAAGCALLQDGRTASPVAALRRSAAAASKRSVALTAKVQMDVHRRVEGRVARVHAAAWAVGHCAGGRAGEAGRVSRVFATTCWNASESRWLAAAVQMQCCSTSWAMQSCGLGHPRRTGGAATAGSKLAHAALSVPGGAHRCKGPGGGGRAGAPLRAPAHALSG